jgi:hypothetical protein
MNVLSKLVKWISQVERVRVSGESAETHYQTLGVILLWRLCVVTVRLTVKRFKASWRIVLSSLNTVGVKLSAYFQITIHVMNHDNHLFKSLRRRKHQKDHHIKYEILVKSQILVEDEAVSFRLASRVFVGVGSKRTLKSADHHILKT